MVEHAADGSVLSVDEWDDGLPFTPAESASKGFTSVMFTPFDTESPHDVRRLADELDQVDYVVQSSDRITGAIGRVPARYAPVLRYQQALEDGSLGFESVATFSTRPSLFGVEVDDSGSEEAFRVYDHPTVRIWRKTAAFSLASALEVLQSDRAAASVHVPLDEAPANGLLLREGAASDPGGSKGSTFDEVFWDRLPVAPLWWLAWWELTAFAALGWSAGLFRSLPDRGVGLTKIVGPLAVVIPLWSAVAWGPARFSAVTAAAATLLAVLVGWGVPRWRREALTLLRTHRRAIVTVEVVTLVVFAAVLALRATVPDLWFHPSGGEKPFETAFFTSVARTSTLPPADPWYSGGAMNYYYGSWFSMAVPTRLLGIRPEVALNLAIATAASLIGAASYTVGSALGSLGRRGSTADRRGLVAGLLAAGSLVLLGNLDTVRQLSARASPFDWWSVSRLNPSTTDINEFPAWSVLFGDAHPHLLSLPVLIVVIAALVAYVARPRAASAILIGAGIAWVRIGHTWDLPVLVALTVAAVLLGATRGTGDARKRYQRAFGHLLLVGTVTVVVARPYVRTSAVFDRGFTLAAATTPLGAFLLQYGIPLGIVTMFLIRQALWSRGSVRPPDMLRSPGGIAGAVAVAVGVLVTAIALRGPVIGLALAVIAATLVSAVVDLRRGRLGRGLAAVLVASGVGLAALPEVVVVINDIGRQNTVFKFGYTAWVLTALGAAALAAELVVTGSAGRARWWRAAVVVVVAPGLLFWPVATPPRVAARFAPLGPTLDGRAWLDHGPVAVEANGVPSIDVTQDEQLIGWLRAHGRNGETLVEATGPPYTWVGRMSVATGLPTVIGWSTHETQQRRGFADTIDQRVSAVDDLYRVSDDERARRVLATYRPDYVVVGTVEHALGDPAAIAGLAKLPGLDPAFSAGEGVIYRVDLERIDRDLARLDAKRIREGSAGGSG
jgi:YYY domain-containing protein